MADDAIWLLIVGGAGFLLLLFAWRRFDPAALTVIRESEAPDEPCWTEEIGREGDRSYGLSGCYDENLKEMDARARLGEFDTRA